MDHQTVDSEPKTWYTAKIEIVDDEALFRMGNHVAYAKAERIDAPRNLVSFTLGTTWHEIKRGRIWYAETNSEWQSRIRFSSCANHSLPDHADKPIDKRSNIENPI